MELSARELLVLFAMVDRIKEEKTVLACQVEWLVVRLVQKESPVCTGERRAPSSFEHTAGSVKEDRSGDDCSERSSG